MSHPLSIYDEAPNDGDDRMTTCYYCDAPIPVDPDDMYPKCAACLNGEPIDDDPYQLQDTALFRQINAATLTALDNVIAQWNALPPKEKAEALKQINKGFDEEVHRVNGDDYDDDPRCICGVYRSEHQLCGCPDGFQLPGSIDPLICSECGQAYADNDTIYSLCDDCLAHERATYQDEQRAYRD